MYELMATEMKCRVRVLSALLCALSFATLSHAEPLFPLTPCGANSYARLDTSPHVISNSAPANSMGPRNLTRPKEIIPLGCNRPFLYQGEYYNIDSPQAQDSQNLKSATKDSPEAQTYLTEYQNNRKRARISAYTGTLGAFIAIFSTGLGRWLNPRQPKTIQMAALLTGAAIATEGFSYSLSLMRVNETLIPRAVDAHNKNKPNDPIELQLNAGWSF
jgi:hypothetical protein